MRMILLGGISIAVLAIQMLTAHPQAQAGGQVTAAEGAALLEEVCGSCHSVDAATADRRTPEQWAEVISAMADIGAVMTPQQRTVIHSYLSTNFGPAPPTTSASGPPFQSPAPPAAPATPATARSNGAGRRCLPGT